MASIIRCPECGKILEDNVRVCPDCGYPLPQQTQKQQNYSVSSEADSKSVLNLLSNESILFEAEWSYLLVWLCAIIGLLFSIWGFTMDTTMGIIMLIVFAILTWVAYKNIKKKKFFITNCRVVTNIGMLFEMPIENWESILVSGPIFIIRGIGGTWIVIGGIKNGYEARACFTNLKNK